jgi:hypothetical protein
MSFQLLLQEILTTPLSKRYEHFQDIVDIEWINWGGNYPVCYYKTRGKVENPCFCHVFCSNSTLNQPEEHIN